MRHIRFLDTKASLCERPDLLGKDFVVVDVGLHDEQSCSMCHELIFHHNAKAFEKDIADVVRLSNANRQATVDSHHDHAARGVALGCAIASLLWIIALVIVWMVAK